MNLVAMGVSLLLPMVSSAISTITGSGPPGAKTAGKAASAGTVGGASFGEMFQANLMGTLMKAVSQQQGNAGTAVNNYASKAAEGTATEADYQKAAEELAQKFLQKAEGREPDQSLSAAYLNSALNSYQAQAYYGGNKLL